MLIFSLSLASPYADLSALRRHKGDLYKETRIETSNQAKEQTTPTKKRALQPQPCMVRPLSAPTTPSLCNTLEIESPTTVARSMLSVSRHV